MSQLGKRSSRSGGVVDVVVIGAGQAGLSASYLLEQRGIDHIVLERGEIANSWKHERWDSLRLLTPNWQTQLPGFHYAGDDPQGFMERSELIEFIERYAELSDAPVITGAEVRDVSPQGGGYRVQSSKGNWQTKAVIIASGACNIPKIPAVAQKLPAGIQQLTPFEYDGPESLADGGVLIVGASATGMQFADELLQAGREVVVAVGEHVRLPRRYRGRDILDWMDACGVLDERYDEIEDLVRARNLPSSQLLGRSELPFLDLNYLAGRGARIAGRLMAVSGDAAQFSGSLRNVCDLADLKMNRLLRTIDEAIGADPDVAPPEHFDPTGISDQPLLTLDFKKENINTVIWATGFRPDYRWLKAPVLDRKGQLVHQGGVVSAPGLYVLGLPMMRTRKSSFLFGIEDDAREITDHLAHFLQIDPRRNHHDLHSNYSDRGSNRRCA